MRLKKSRTKRKEERDININDANDRSTLHFICGEKSIKLFDEIMKEVINSYPDHYAIKFKYNKT